MDSALRPLTPEEIAAYDEDGVFVARGLFPEHWIQRMSDAVDRVVAEPSLFGRATSIPEKQFSMDAFVWKWNDDFRDWVYQSPAARIAQQVLRNRRVRHFYDQLFVKPSGCHVPTPWHHDITFWPVDMESQAICSIWITFDPITRDSSGLEFVKGSHRWPDRLKAITPDHDPYMMDSAFADPPDIDRHREDYDLFCPDLDAGDCLIFNAHVVHGSSSNTTTDTPRRALSTRWIGGDIAYDPRHATMPLLWEHGLTAGEPLAGPLFPQVLPETIATEGAHRSEGPETPSSALLQEFAIKAAAAGRRTPPVP